MAVRETRKKTKAAPKVGDHVRLPYGAGDMVAVILEDRGNLGVGGRRILRIRPVDPPMSPFEIPAEEVTLIKNGRSRS